MSSVGTVTAPDTLDECLALQESSNVLVAPASSTNSTLQAATATTVSTDTTATTLSIALVNQTTSSTVYAYITGLATDNDNALWLLESDGSTSYYPTAPSAIGSDLAADCAIALGAPGTTTTVTIPYLAGARIWYSIGSTITFLLNPTDTGGAALVQPSVTNESDPNIDIMWDFCEFTYNDFELYINISYVDFVSIPVALTLLNTSGDTSHVSGMASDGLTTICEGLTAQTASDGYGWSDLIVTASDGSYLRALSPNSGIQLNSSLLSGYYDSYVSSVWSQYSSETLTVDTQAEWGTVTGSVVDNLLTFTDVGTFAQPSTADIFNCSSGPFAATTDNTAEMGAITARLTAALNRATLLSDTSQPDGEVVSNYYTNSICNQYGRIVHAANLDGKGYTFPYDDVSPSSGEDTDQSGYLADGSPSLLTVTIGGGDAYAKVKSRNAPLPRRSNKPVPLSKYGRREQKLRGLGHIKIPKRHQKRSLNFFGGSQTSPAASVKTQAAADLKVQPIDIDLEKGLPVGSEKQQMLLEWQNEMRTAEKKFPAIVQRILNSKMLATLRTYASDPRIKPVVNVLNNVIAGVLSLTMRAFMSRMFVLFFVFLLYVFVDGKKDGGQASQGFVMMPTPSAVPSVMPVNGTTLQGLL